ncbi:MAG: winged helix-turn-helix transcriptional regulator [Candidatus Diapherotrites archaeon]|jgi:predicted transcriptional regulator|uniref:Winged helix-turn-helix transcriptional regulator n=1 Tax=Candidatus Iainarchaeum sp. TaxID=3101447 RepID=A0A8T5GDY1_9ARCH|nr:winged helix-turn-helix transcriptional regulator [Candidatus Diapherotrites archaeon]MBT7241674.1 winged helix-turn-helix transcriptional regulator [Candidatus Diapherotrites archaeon]
MDLEETMALSPRDRIYSMIIQNPGLHFREIQRRVDIATGALQYHIDYLKKKHLIYEEKEGKFSRFYAHQEQKIDEKLMNLLRQDQVRQIVLFLLTKRRATIKTIVKEMELSTSTTKFHLQKLLDTGIVLEKESQGKTFYSLKEREPIMELLIVYKKSFMDSLVDNFVEIWEEELGL